MDSESQCFDESLPPAPAALDFQAEYLKFFLKPNEIEAAATRAISTYEPSTQLEYDSQTDVETVVRTYMTGNPDWNENIATKVSVNHVCWLIFFSLNRNAFSIIFIDLNLVSHSILKHFWNREIFLLQLKLAIRMSRSNQRRLNSVDLDTQTGLHSAHCHWKLKMFFVFRPNVMILNDGMVTRKSMGKISKPLCFMADAKRVVRLVHKKAETSDSMKLMMAAT